MRWVGGGGSGWEGGVGVSWGGTHQGSKHKCFSRGRTLKWTGGKRGVRVKGRGVWTWRDSGGGVPFFRSLHSTILPYRSLSHILFSFSHLFSLTIYTHLFFLLPPPFTTLYHHFQFLLYHIIIASLSWLPPSLPSLLFYIYLSTLPSFLHYHNTILHTINTLTSYHGIEP